jgi:predicted nucleotidyltransferase
LLEMSVDYAILKSVRKSVNLMRRDTRARRMFPSPDPPSPLELRCGGRYYLLEMDTGNASIDAALADLKARLRALLGDSLVRLDLFGSRAHGDEYGDSDIDVAVVVRGLDGPVRESILTEVAEIELRHLTPLSVVLFSEENFFDLLRRERRIAMDIVSEGKPL